MCPDSQRLHQQSHEGTGRRGCARFSGLPQELDHSPHSTELELWNSPPLTPPPVRRVPRRRKLPGVEESTKRHASERDEGLTRPEQNRYRFIAPHQTVAGQRRRFGCWTFSRSSGRLATCRRSAASCSKRQLMFLKKEKDPISKQFDDDEWIRSLTEAQEATTDVPKDSVMYDQQEVYP